MAKLKNLKCDKTQKNKLWQNLKTQIVTNLKYSNCDKSQILKSWQNFLFLFLQNSNTQIVTTEIVTIIKLWQNSNCDKTQNVKKPPRVCNLNDFLRATCFFAWRAWQGSPQLRISLRFVCFQKIFFSEKSRWLVMKWEKFRIVNMYYCAFF